MGQTLGKWLAYYRGNMSVRELAEKASVSKSVINRLEKGRSGDPSLGKVLRLQRALGLPSIEMLLGGPHAFPSDPDGEDSA